MKKIWKETLKILKKEIMESPYNTFITSLEPVSLQEKDGKKELTLQAENEYAKDRIESLYQNIINDSLRKATNSPCCTRIVLKSEVKKNKGKTPVVQTTTKGTPINPQYTFDNFVIGKSNKLAQAVSYSVAKAPGSSAAYNPLFIYGGVGLGKTHLINAIANDIMENQPQLDVLYVNCETFVNDFISSIVRNDIRSEELRKKYRSVDVLIVDDIEFLIGKDASQEEFFHTFEALYNNNKQIVLTSDKSPTELKKFEIEERLTSRFSWKMVVDIAPPNLETRIAILRKKAELEQIELTEGVLDAIDLIAEKIPYNVRDLESALFQLQTHAKLENKPITRSYAYTILKDTFSNTGSDISPQRIKKEVADYFQISVEDLESKKRGTTITNPRHIAMYLCREMTHLSYPKIGNEFGGRDHSTVMNACKKIESDIKINANLSDVIRTITENMEN